MSAYSIFLRLFVIFVQKRFVRVKYFMSSNTSLTESFSSEPTAMKESLKRKANSVSSGYKSDDEGSRTQNSISQTLSNPTAMQVPSALCALAPPGQDAQVSRGQKKGKPRVGDMKREERNAREKERSYRITSQINELRGLLSTGGVIVPKGTKNAVLTEAANYIRILQQQQYKSEM